MLPDKENWVPKEGNPCVGENGKQMKDIVNRIAQKAGIPEE